MTRTAGNLRLSPEASMQRTPCVRQKCGSEDRGLHNIDRFSGRPFDADFVPHWHPNLAVSRNYQDFNGIRPRAGDKRFATHLGLPYPSPRSRLPSFAMTSPQACRASAKPAGVMPSVLR
jgi:hypothetical protein